MRTCPNTTTAAGNFREDFGGEMQDRRYSRDLSHALRSVFIDVESVVVYFSKQGEQMGKFIVLYHAPASANQQMENASPEEMQAGMQAWMKWAEACGSGLVDMGAPLANGQSVTTSGTVASDREVTGYSILQAESMEAAVAMLQGHPHLGWAEGCSIEVHESMPLPGM